MTAFQGEFEFISKVEREEAQPISISDWTTHCYNAAHRAGWWNETENIPLSVLYATKIALIHSEISEALEGIRKNIQDTHLPHRKAVEVELADALIRIFDLGGAMALDLEGAVREKLEYNQYRPDHKLEVRTSKGGKQF